MRTILTEVFHLNLASHLSHRNDKGWRMAELEWIAHVESNVEIGRYSRVHSDTFLESLGGENSEHPLWVTPISRCLQCLKALSKIFQEELLPILSVRLTTCQIIVYDFVNY